MELEACMDNISLSKKNLEENMSSVEEPACDQIDGQGNKCFESTDDTELDQENRNNCGTEMNDNFHDASDSEPLSYQPITNAEKEEDYGTDESISNEESESGGDTDHDDNPLVEGLKGASQSDEEMENESYKVDSLLEQVNKDEWKEKIEKQSVELCESVNSIYQNTDQVCVSDEVFSNDNLVTLSEVSGHSDDLSENEDNNSHCDGEVDLTMVSDADGQEILSPDDIFAVLNETDETFEENKVGSGDSNNHFLKGIPEDVDSDTEIIGETCEELKSEVFVSPDALLQTVEDNEAGDASVLCCAGHFEVESVNEPSDLIFNNTLPHTDNDAKFEDHESTSNHLLTQKSDIKDKDLTIEKAIQSVSASKLEVRRHGRFSREKSVSVDKALPARVEKPTAEHEAVRRAISTSDTYKEPSGVVLRQKTKSKRVDSIRKSLIKGFGSFGKEHGNSKTKNKKDKDKHKGETLEIFATPSKAEHESVSEHTPLGSQTALAPPCDPNQKPSSSAGSSEPQVFPVPSVISPTAHRISNPLAVDAEKLQEYSAQKQSTMQMMHQQAAEEYLKRQSEYKRNPTEPNKMALEQQRKVVHRLQANLEPSVLGQMMASAEPEVSPQSVSSVGSSSAADNSQFLSLDSSMDSACFMEEKRDYLAGLPPAHGSASVIPRHKKRLQETSKESTLSRSHSDSCKRIQKESEDGLRQGTSTDDLSSLRLIAARQSVTKRHSQLLGSKPKVGNSENSSDSAIDQLSSRSDKGSILSGESSSNSSLYKNSRPIIALDDQEFESEEENVEVRDGPFSSFRHLKDLPAHLAVFLHYLISNSDPSPLLFYLVTETYPQGSGKELRKWAYEIYSTFVADKALLKITVDDRIVDAINVILQNSCKQDDDVMKAIFQHARSLTEGTIDELLADFRCKQALGLGSIYGDHELKQVQDHAAALKVIETTLWNHFERLVAEEDSERSIAMAAALAFFFKQHGYTNTKNSMLQERCPLFNVKEKTKFQVFSKPSKKALFQKGHQLLLQQYITMTYCQVCQGLLCGVGCQGLQCQKCELSFHKNCVDGIKESCGGKKLRPPVVVDKPKPLPPAVVDKPKPSTVFSKNISKLKRKPSNAAATAATGAKERRNVEESITGIASNIFIQMDAQNEEDHAKDPSLSVGQSANKLDKGDVQKPAEDIKPSPSPSRSSLEDVSSGVEHFVYSEFSEQHSIKSVSSRFQENGFVINVPTDSDFETEADLPPLDSIIPKDQLKKMKPKEKKRQEVINELFYTERAHVRNLKVMRSLFYVPMQNNLPTDFVELLFPNIDDMIDVHGNLNKDFKQKRKESENNIVGDFANILIKHFSGQMGERFQNVCARFCEKQSYALENLKTRQRKDLKLANLLQEANSNSLCRRLELKDYLPTAMQRLTKYPLLIENLLKYTQPDLEEHAALQQAYRSSKEILNHVNKAVRDCENHCKLRELQKKLDKRQIENSSLKDAAEYKSLDLTRHTMLYDGVLTWRFSRDRLINVHVVLLSDILVLLQKQDDRLVLRCQSSLIVAGKEDTKLTHSPILKLTNLLVKPVATDKCAFFVVSVSEVGPQIYDLVAGSKDEKNKWFKQINEAIEIAKANNPQAKFPVTSTKSAPVSQTDDTLKIHDTPSEIVSQVQECEEVIPFESIVCNQEDDRRKLLEVAGGDDVIEQNGGEENFMKSDDLVAAPTRSFSESLALLRQSDDAIQKSFLDKKELLSCLCQLPEEDPYFAIAPDIEPLDSKGLILSMLKLSSHMMQNANFSLNAEEISEPDSKPDSHDHGPVIETVGESESGDDSKPNENSEDLIPPPLPPRTPRLSAGTPAPPLPPRLYKSLEKIGGISAVQLFNTTSLINRCLTRLLEIMDREKEEKKSLNAKLLEAQKQLAMIAGGNASLSVILPSVSSSASEEADEVILSDLPDVLVHANMQTVALEVVDEAKCEEATSCVVASIPEVYIEHASDSPVATDAENTSLECHSIWEDAVDIEQGAHLRSDSDIAENDGDKFFADALSSTDLETNNEDIVLEAADIDCLGEAREITDSDGKSQEAIENTSDCC